MLQLSGIPSKINAGTSITPPTEPSFKGDIRYPVNLTIAAGEEAPPAHICGVIFSPIEQVIGLRAWNDTIEFTKETTLFSLFDIEKAIRMFLHASLLIYDYLAALLNHRETPPESVLSILQWTINQRHSQALLRRSLIPFFGSREKELSALNISIQKTLLRRTLQLLLLHRGIIATNLYDMLTRFINTSKSQPSDELKQTLINHYASDKETTLPPTLYQQEIKWANLALKKLILEEWEEIQDGKKLPETPSNFNDLNQFLIDTRLQTLSEKRNATT